MVNRFDPNEQTQTRNEMLLAVNMQPNLDYQMFQQKSNQCYAKSQLNFFQKDTSSYQSIFKNDDDMVKLQTVDSNDNFDQSSQKKIPFKFGVINKLDRNRMKQKTDSQDDNFSTKILNNVSNLPQHSIRLQASKPWICSNLKPRTDHSRKLEKYMKNITAKANDI